MIFGLCLLLFFFFFTFGPLDRVREIGNVQGEDIIEVAVSLTAPKDVDLPVDQGGRVAVPRLGPLTLHPRSGPFHGGEAQHSHVVV